MQPEAMPSSMGLQPQSRSAAPGYAAVTFVLCAVLFTATLSVVGVVVHVVQSVSPAANGTLLAMLLNVLILSVGLLAIARSRVPEMRALSAIGLMRRPSAARESGLGAAAGWAIGIALVLPGILLARMHSTLTVDGFHLGAAVSSALVLLLFVAGRQLVLCGLPFRSLTQATSPFFATVAFAGVAALLAMYTARADLAEATLAAMAQVVFCMAASRTRALWLGGALQFAWGLTVTLLFGLPSFLWPSAVSVVDGRMYGPRWLTGNRAGPEAALWAGVVVLAALIAVWRMTRDYAWHYTFDPIVGAGYAMDVPPPAEHTRMEQAAQTAPLVQIGNMSTTPSQPLPPLNDPPQKL